MSLASLIKDYIFTDFETCSWNARELLNLFSAMVLNIVIDYHKMVLNIAIHYHKLFKLGSSDVSTYMYEKQYMQNPNQLIST